jgi:outer membrane protein TolC
MAWGDVELAWGAFEPEAFAAAGKQFIHGVSLVGTTSRSLTDAALRAGNITIYQTEDATYDVVRGGFGAKLPTGATFEFSSGTNTSAVGSGNATYAAATEVSLRQPLLRGAGLAVNLLPVRFAKIEVKQANTEVRRSILELVRNVETQWWEVVYAYRDRELSAKTLGIAENLLAEANARVKVGLATEIETLQANTGLAARREAIIIADQRIEDRMDDLLLLLGQLGKARYKIALPDGLPGIRGSNLSHEQTIALARALPDYSLQMDSIQQHKLLVDRARNDLLPRLDLVASGGYSGLGYQTGTAYDQAFGRTTPDWQLLAEVRIPLGFMSERAQLRKSKSALQIEELRRQDLEQSLYSQIREAERAVTAGLSRMELTRASAQLSDQQFGQLLARYKEGLGTFREMQLAAEDVQEAGSRLLAAQLDAIRASLRMARLDGTLLSRHHLTWAEEK